MEQEYKKKFLLDAAFFAVIAVLLYIGVRYLLGFLFPFIIAFIIAYFAAKPAEFISKKTKIRQDICAVIAAVLIYVLIIAVSVAVLLFLKYLAEEALKALPDVIKPIAAAFVNTRKNINRIFGSVSHLFGNMPSDMLDGFVKNSFEKLSSWLSGFAANILSKTPGLILTAIITLVLSCYIAKDYKKLKKFVTSVVSEKVCNFTQKITYILKNSIFKMIKGYIILSLITFAELSIAFSLLGIKNPISIAALTAFVDLLPVFGTGTVLLPWGLTCIFLGKPLGFAIIVIYFICVLVRNFAEPKIIGKQIGISPLITLVTMFAGYRLAGFWGLVLLPVSFIVAVKYYKEYPD